MPDRVAFECNGRAIDVEIADGETLLSVLRERLELVSVKDGCAPQGQCGCCTVLVDGEARVSCVTPAARVAGRAVTTIEGLDPALRDRMASAFVATGGSQCGFCTPGIVLRAVALAGRGKTARVDLDRALAAHLCRCTGWLTVYAAVDRALGSSAADIEARDLHAAAARAALEGGTAQVVDFGVPLGGAPFADDRAPRDALVAVPLPPDSDAEAIDAAGARWVVGESLLDARTRAGKVQGRRTTFEEVPPLPLAALPDGGVRLATSWVEPAYLEPDASWSAPGAPPATPLANGGAFGGKLHSLAPRAAEELATTLGRTVRVVLAREDVVRAGPKRPPIAATAVWRDNAVHIDGVVVAGGLEAFTSEWPTPYTCAIHAHWTEMPVAGPPVGTELRAVGLAEHSVLVEGALDAAGIDRAALVRDGRARAVVLDTCVEAPGGTLAGARAEVDPATGAITRIEIRVAAGDPLDEIVLRSYAIGAAHMALGWVCTEGIAVDPATGEVHDLTIRSFGIVRAKDVPPIDVTIVADDGPARPRASDAVFGAVAAAVWNALTRAEGTRPDTFPARVTRAARRLRR